MYRGRCWPAKVLMPSLCPPRRSDCSECGKIPCSPHSVSTKAGVEFSDSLPTKASSTVAVAGGGRGILHFHLLVGQAKPNLPLQTCASKEIWGVAMVSGEAGVWGRSVGWCSDRGCLAGASHGSGMAHQCRCCGMSFQGT